MKSSFPDKKSLLRELHKVRHASLIATRKGDFRQLAVLTAAVSRLNHAILEHDVTAPHEESSLDLNQSSN